MSIFLLGDGQLIVQAGGFAKSVTEPLASTEAKVSDEAGPVVVVQPPVAEGKKLAQIDQALALNAVSGDPDLVSEIQECLILYGLLDPLVDGLFGGVSSWALAEFCSQKGIDIGEGLSKQLANELLKASKNPLPVSPGGDLAGRIVTTMLRLHYWVSRHPKCMNIVYVEGMNVDGTPNENKSNQFNDCRCLVSVNASGKPRLVGAWKATTEPSKYWTQNPKDPNGAARIAFGQYKAWSVGMYHNQEVLRQVSDVTVYRDLNMDYSRKGDKTYAGVFGIHHHWGYDLPDKDLGNSSAGRLVGQKRNEHRTFMELVKDDPRFDKATNSYRFMAAILPYAELPSA